MTSTPEKKDDVEAYVQPVLPMDAAVQHHKYGQTKFHRGLLGRHIQLLSIGGVIGTGLFIGSGRAITNAGPLSCVLAYGIYSLIILFVSQGAGEMATLLPIQGSFVTWSTRFTNPAAGFATGWNYYYTCIAFAGADVVACVGLVQYWLPDVNAAAWVTLTLAVFALLSFVPVRIYGTAEFYFAIGKVVLIVGLICMTFVLMLGGNPNHDRFGFRYWRDPGVMKEYIVPGALGRFLGWFYTFKIAAFSIGGPEFVSMASAEAVNPRRSIPKAIRRVFWRLTVFYVVGILCVGILVPYNDEQLIYNIANSLGVGASPWVRGMELAGLNKILPNIMNAVVLTSALSCGNSFVFVAIRTLHGLAAQGKAPRILARTSKSGIPIYASALTISILLLSYMSASSKTAKVFGWFLDLAACGALANYSWMVLAWINFRRAAKAQGIYNDLPFRGFGLPLGAYFALFFLLLIIVFNGFNVFINGQWDVQSFVTSYFTIPLNLFLYGLGLALYKHPRFIKPELVDLDTDRAEIDEDERYWKDNAPDPKTLSRWERFLEWAF